MRRCEMTRVLEIYSNLDDQRMTAAGGILNEELHSRAFRVAAADRFSWCYA